MVQSNVPFRFVDNHYLSLAFSLIKVQMPKSTQMRTNHLSKLSESANKWIAEEIESSMYVSIRLDGWKNTNSDQITNIVVKTRGKQR